MAAAWRLLGGQCIHSPKHQPSRKDAAAAHKRFLLLAVPQEEAEAGPADPRRRGAATTLSSWVGMQASAGASVCLVGTAASTPSLFTLSTVAGFLKISLV